MVLQGEVAVLVPKNNEIESTSEEEEEEEEEDNEHTHQTDCAHFDIEAGPKNRRYTCQFRQETFNIDQIPFVKWVKLIYP